MNTAFQPDHSRLGNYLIAIAQENVAGAGSEGQGVGAAPGARLGGVPPLPKILSQIAVDSGFFFLKIKGEKNN